MKIVDAEEAASEEEEEQGEGEEEQGEEEGEEEEEEEQGEEQGEEEQGEEEEEEEGEEEQGEEEQGEEEGEGEEGEEEGKEEQEASEVEEEGEEARERAAAQEKARRALKRGEEAFVGLKEAKAVLKQKVNAAIGRGQRSIVDDTEASYNFFITGDSGVGKTSIVKQMMYEPLHALGVLPGKFVEKTPKELQKAGALEEALEEADGGMLFTDEAYGLGNSAATTTHLVALVPPQGGNVANVVAGYKDKMFTWLGTNQGLAARFPHQIDIPAYTADELVDIGALFIKNAGFAELGEEAKEVLREAAEYVVSLSSSTSVLVSRNANAIGAVVNVKGGGAMEVFYAEKGAAGIVEVPDKDKKLTKAHLKAGLAAFKKMVASASAGSSGGGASGGGGGVPGGGGGNNDVDKVRPAKRQTQ